MSGTFALILRDVPEAGRPAVAQFLAKAFALKENTSDTIASSAPIGIITGLTREEAAALSLVMATLSRIPGVQVEFSQAFSDELPKIDWPRRPLLFKREIADYVLDLQTPVPLPDGQQCAVLDLLVARLGGDDAGTRSKHYKPQEIAPLGELAGAGKPGSTKQQFRGAQMPEITPFFNQALPGTAATSRPKGGGGDEASARLNEMFPEEDAAGFMPDSNNITSILDKLLPDEEQPIDGGAPAPTGRPVSTPSGRHPIASNGFSVFLAKIGDEQRRTKAVPIIAELAKISNDEAESLSKKVIIPVVKGVSKEDAEAAKQRFAKIGILARIKGAETVA